MRLIAARGLVRELSRAVSTEPTYVELGATGGPLPPAYWHFSRREGLGHGSPVFEAAVETVMTWGMHRGAGLRPAASGPRAVLGATVVMCAGWGGVGVAAGCRVVRVIDEADRRGFAYGTLPGHPEIGEEAFVVERDDDDEVWLTITAFSRPNGVLPTLAGPVGRRVQNLLTGRYVRAVREVAAGTGGT
ncbi:DUF1990 family protein [Frankia sp. AgKG'84/4]|uniref:DUF1990 family protein n=1 Tax=Frankia sp. AgKG'84/4 TaxID=573490 RepID=UPI00200F3AC0|nr:DUF1990 domain-containing protein [Frankia sp. AgKG'84/4]MCL9794781.1 DUF1990 domain-containing protein [Frankia sp. AgKG'84/4]